MDKLIIKTKQDLKNYKDSKEVANLFFKQWDGSYIYLEGATTGDINLEGTTTGGVYLNNATTGDINLEGATTWYINLEGATTRCINLNGATTRYINLKGAKYKSIVQKYDDEDFELLESLPMDVICLKQWQSNDNWLKAKTIEELHTCGTTYCIRGYAEAQYFIKHGKKHPSPEELFPNLKHLFFISDYQFRVEREKILSQKPYK